MRRATRKSLEKKQVNIQEIKGQIMKKRKISFQLIDGTQ
jgi:hypothetical protein